MTDDSVTGTAAWREFCAARGLRPVETIARGFDFTVLRMADATGADLAVRLPHARFSSDANDPHVDRRILLTQEYTLAGHLARYGVPAAEPVELFRSARFDALVSRYLPDDGAGVDGPALGALLARLHATPPPTGELDASEGGRPQPRRSGACCGDGRSWPGWSLGCRRRRTGAHCPPGWPAPGGSKPSCTSTCVWPTCDASAGATPCSSTGPTRWWVIPHWSWPG